LGEKFNAEAEDFVKHLQKQKKIKYIKVPFNALFGDVICRMNQKNNKKLLGLMDDILKSFSSDLYEYGISSVVESYYLLSDDFATFQTIPYTFKQFQDAVKVYNNKKGKRSKKDMNVRHIFEYEPPVLKKEKTFEMSDKTRIQLNDLAPNSLGENSYFSIANIKQVSLNKYYGYFMKIMIHISYLGSRSTGEQISL